MTRATAELYWNRRPAHRVTHREVGHIPGCILAPRAGIFKNTSPEDARKITGARGDMYAAYLTKYVQGEYGGKEGLADMWSAIGVMPPMFGPFGEKL